MPTYKQLSTIPRWLKFTVTYSDLAIAGLTNDVEIYSLPANAYISSCQIVPTTLFSGGTIATYTISVGKTGDLTMSCVPRNVFTGAPALPAPGGQSGVQSMSVATSSCYFHCWKLRCCYSW